MSVTTVAWKISLFCPWKAKPSRTPISFPQFWRHSCRYSESQRMRSTDNMEERIVAQTAQMETSTIPGSISQMLLSRTWIKISDTSQIRYSHEGNTDTAYSTRCDWSQLLHKAEPIQQDKTIRSNSGPSVIRPTIERLLKSNKQKTKQYQPINKPKETYVKYKLSFEKLQ